MSEFVPVVTEGMRKATWYIAPEPTETQVFSAMTAHHDFQRQLRAYVAEQMRGLVPDIAYMSTHGTNAACNAWDNCRAETLANIEKWEISNGQ